MQVNKRKQRRKERISIVLDPLWKPTLKGELEGSTQACYFRADAAIFHFPQKDSSTWLEWALLGMACLLALYSVPLHPLQSAYITPTLSGKRNTEGQKLKNLQW